jgi:hypothetical protein
MSDWEQIAKKFAEVSGGKLMFVNNTSLGIEWPNGQFSHLYIDEVYERLKTAQEQGS